MGSTKLPTTSKQIATCGLFVVMGVAITAIFQSRPLFHEWRVGLPIERQLFVAGAFGLLVAVGVEIAFRFPRLRSAIVVPPAMRGMELAGTKPLSISLAAGVGEEILFRAALQPLLGLWLASAIFAVTHFRTAELASSATKKVIYLVNVFLLGAALGLVFQYLGLLAAILAHAIID